MLSDARAAPRALFFKAVHPPLHEPSDAQKQAGNYAKRKIAWRGLTISIENEQGSMRRGTNRDGGTWEQRMAAPYGEILRTEGTDGDPVDVFVGPNLDAPTVYVVHARKVNRWDQFDEDKCMIGWNDAAAAKQAFLDNYSDPRFFGDMTAMPVDEFLAKVKATKGDPSMIKAEQLSLFDTPINIPGSVKKDGTVVKPYTRIQKKAQHPLVAAPKAPVVEPPPKVEVTPPPPPPKPPAETTIKLTEAQRSVMEINVLDPAFDDDEAREHYPHVALLREYYDHKKGVLRVPADKVQAIKDALTEVANSEDAQAEEQNDKRARGASDAISNLQRKVKTPPPEPEPPRPPGATHKHRDHLIRVSGVDGGTWIEKDGLYIGDAKSPEDAIDQIDTLENKKGLPPPVAFAQFGAAGENKTERRRINAAVVDLLTQHKTEYTGEDKALMARYSGNGGCGDSLNEFYTDPAIATAMWTAIERLGVAGGTALEPSCATGVFLHTAPPKMKVTGVEIDGVSAQVAAALHDRHEIRQSSLEQFATGDERQYDAVVGNAPFGIRGGTLKDDKPAIATADSYFIDTAIDKARPGGIVAMIVNHGVMDTARDYNMRKKFLNKAEFLGAIRMPNTAFEHSHTEVTADIVFFKKRPQDVANALGVISDVQRAELGLKDDEYLTGGYFEGRGKDNILGVVEPGWRAKAGMGNDITVAGSMVGVPDQIAQFEPDEAPRATPTMTDILALVTGDPKQTARIMGAAVKRPYELIKPGSTKTVDGIQYILEGRPPRWHRIDEVMDRAAVTDAEDAAAAIDRIIADPELYNAADRKEVADAVKAYVATHGLPSKNHDLVLAAHQNQALYRLIGAVHADGSLSDILTNEPEPVEKSSFETATQTLAVERQEGLFTPEDVAKRTGKSLADVDDLLHASNDYAYDAASGKWTTTAVYLTGELWPKLDAVVAALARPDIDASLRVKYELQQAKLIGTIDPKGMEDIDVEINHAFIPANILAAFFNERRDASENDWIRKSEDISIKFEGGLYTVDGSDLTTRKLLTHYLNRDHVEKDDWADIVTLNKEFKDWIMSSRFRDELETRYNRAFKGFVPPVFTNDKIDIPGMNTEGLKDYQYGGVRWALAHGKGIIAADVGLGKTVRALMIARLMKLEGKAKRNMIVVPKSVIGNWAKEAERWFPGTKVLVIGETTVGKKTDADNADQRNKKYHQYMQNDYDFVFITQPAFNDLDVDPVVKGEYLEQEFWVQRGDALAGGKGKGGDKRIKKIRESHAAENARRQFGTHSDAIYFNQLGVDLLIADEAHCFPAGTLVDGRPIETYKAGDTVRTYDHALGRVVKGRVANLQIRRPVDLYRVTVGGQSVTCTGKHPFFTQRGYVFAKELNVGDTAYKNLYGLTDENQRVSLEKGCAAVDNGGMEMRSVRDMDAAIQGTGLESPGKRKVEFLLQQIMPHVAYPSYAGLPGCDGGGAIPSLFQHQRQGRKQKADDEKQSNARSADASQDDRNAARQGNVLGNSWWQRTWTYGASVIARQCTALANGSRNPWTAAPERGVLNVQSGYRQLGTQDRDRGRRQQPQFTEATADRSTQRENLIACRVDNIEVFQQTGDGTFGGMCPDGNVYNIEVEKHHNYFAENVLVHNSNKNLYSVRNRFGEKPKFLGGGGLSNRALDMQGKARFVRDSHEGKGVFFLTATPTKNSPLEIYSMLAHIAPEEFEKLGIRNSEEFLDRFCDVAKGPCLQTDASIEDSVYVSGFKNMDELRNTMKRYIDRTTAADVGLVLPKRDDHLHLVDMSAEQTAAYEDLREQARASKGEKGGEPESHIFSIMSRMGKAALDLELLDPAKYAGSVSPKYVAMAENVATNVKDGGQIVFCEAIESHDKLKAALVAKGIPANQIAIFNAQTCPTGAERQRIQDQFNTGKLKVVIGNKTMEEGVNLQIGTTDIHHMDIAWEPSTMQQRNGRAVRQGNTQDQVRIHTYLSKGSFDGYRYQSVAAKKSWQDLIWSGGDKVENMERPTMTADEMMVMMSADPDAARIQLEGNKALAQARYVADKTTQASIDFQHYQLMKHNHAKLKNKTSPAAEMLKLKIGSAKGRLAENPYFTAKAALESPNVVLLHPETGTIMEHGAGIERDGKKHVVVGVDPTQQQVTLRSYGGIGSTAHMLTLPVAEMGANVKPFAYNEAAETADMSRQFGEYADTEDAGTLDMEGVRNLPAGVIHANAKKIQARLKSNLSEYRINVPYGASVPFITTTGEAKATASHGAHELAKREDHDLMLPTPENHARMLAEYAKSEQARELRGGAPSHYKRGKSTAGGAMTAHYQQSPTETYRGLDANPWSGAGAFVFGKDFPKQAHTAFEKSQGEHIRHAKTFAEAVRRAAPTIKTGYQGHRWPQNTLAVLFARAKRDGILDTPIADVVPKKTDYGHAADAIDKEVWKSKAPGSVHTSNVRDEAVLPALITLAKNSGYNGLAAAMIVSAKPGLEAAKELIGELPLTDEHVIAAIAHLATKHPEIAAMTVLDNFMEGSEAYMQQTVGHGRADMTFGQLADELRIRAANPPRASEAA